MMVFVIVVVLIEMERSHVTELVIVWRQSRHATRRQWCLWLVHALRCVGAYRHGAVLIVSIGAVYTDSFI